MLCKGVLGKTEIHLFRCKGLSPKGGLMRTHDLTANLQAAQNRKEEVIFILGNGDRAWDIYAFFIYYNMCNGRRMSQILVAIGGAYIEERKESPTQQKYRG